MGLAAHGVVDGSGAGRNGDALQELQDVLGRLLDVGALGHQDRRVVTRVDLVERGLEIVRDLGGVNEDQPDAFGPGGRFRGLCLVQQDLGPEEGVTQLDGVLFGRGAQEEDLLQGVLAALMQLRIGRKLNNEAVPCSFDRFQSGFHDCPPHT
ncbi:MAG: hypothetical protein IPH09_11735 [bacterium]|nr:hypothetical protein [bacterium]